MKKILIVIVLFSLHISIAQSRPFILSTSVTCHRLIDFITKPFYRPIVVGNKSFATKIPNFARLLKRIKDDTPDIYKLITKKTSILINGERLFLYADRKISNLIWIFESINNIDAGLDPYVVKMLNELKKRKNRIDKKLKEIKSNNQFNYVLKQKVSLQALKEKPLSWLSGNINLSGILGEFEVLVKTNNVLAQSMYLKASSFPHNQKAQEINDILSKRLSQQISLYTSADVPTLTQKFPHIFKKVEGDDNDKILTKAISFLESKEFDIVSKKNESQYKIIEVKNYSHPIDLSHVKEGSLHKKTILDQQVEMLEILQFLKLEKTFFPYIALVNGITADAKKVLDDLGVVVLGEVI